MASDKTHFGAPGLWVRSWQLSAQASHAKSTCQPGLPFCPLWGRGPPGLPAGAELSSLSLPRDFFREEGHPVSWGEGRQSGARTRRLGVLHGEGSLRQDGGVWVLGVAHGAAGPAAAETLRQAGHRGHRWWVLSGAQTPGAAGLQVTLGEWLCPLLPAVSKVPCHLEHADPAAQMG